LQLYLYSREPIAS